MQRKWYICRGSVQSHPSEWKKNQRRGRCWSRRYRRRCIKRAADSNSPFATTTMAEAYVQLKRSHDDNCGKFYLYSFLFFSRSWSENWPHHECIFHLFLSSVILIDSSTESPIYVLMMSILAFVYLTLFLVLSLSPLIRHGMLVSLLWWFPLYSCFVNNPLICFLYCSRTPQNPSSVLSSQRRPDVFLHSLWEFSFYLFMR